MIIKVSPPPQVSTGGRHGALVFCRRSAELLRCITDRSLRAMMADITEAESPIAGLPCVNLPTCVYFWAAGIRQWTQLRKRQKMRQKPVCSSSTAASGKNLSRDKKLRLPGFAASLPEMFRIAAAAAVHTASCRDIISSLANCSKKVQIVIIIRPPTKLASP